MTAYFSAVLTGILPSFSDPALKWVSEAACDLHRRAVHVGPDEFLVLVSPLVNDVTGTQTEKIVSAFHGEPFNAILVCETIRFDLSKDVQSAEKETVRRAADLIVQGHADLLIFGDVVRPDESIQLWMVNEHGGCDPKPTSIVLKNGLLSEDFDVETQHKLVAATAAEIAKACSHPKSMNWPLFAQRMQKLGVFLAKARSGLSQKQLYYISNAYSDAIGLLYKYDQGEEWFTKASAFDKDLIEQRKTSAAYEHALAWYAYGELLVTRYNKTGNKADGDSAVAAFEKVIGLYSNDADFWHDYGYLLESRYRKTGDKADIDSAIATFGRGIDLYPNLAYLWQHRGFAHFANDEYEDANQDLTRALELHRDWETLNGACDARTHFGDIAGALRDCNESLSLAPNEYMTLDSRAFAFLKSGRYDEARADFKKALSLNAKIATSLYGLGIVEQRTGDPHWPVNIAAAKAIQADVAEEVATYKLGEYGLAR